MEGRAALQQHGAAAPQHSAQSHGIGKSLAPAATPRAALATPPRPRPDATALARDAAVARNHARCDARRQTVNRFEHEVRHQTKPALPPGKRALAECALPEQLIKAVAGARLRARCPTCAEQTFMATPGAQRPAADAGRADDQRRRAWAGGGPQAEPTGGIHDLPAQHALDPALHRAQSRRLPILGKASMGVAKCAHDSGTSLSTHRCRAWLRSLGCAPAVDMAIDAPLIGRLMTPVTSPCMDANVSPREWNAPAATLANSTAHIDPGGQPLAKFGKAANRNCCALAARPGYCRSQRAALASHYGMARSTATALAGRRPAAQRRRAALARSLAPAPHRRAALAKRRPRPQPDAPALARDAAVWRKPCAVRLAKKRAVASPLPGALGPRRRRGEPGPELELRIKNTKAFTACQAERWGRVRVPRAAHQVSGRGKACVLDAPHAPEQTFGNTQARSAQQLMLDVLTINGAGMGWAVDFKLTDWVVPGNAWTHQGTYMTALADIAAAAGGYLQPHTTPTPRNSACCHCGPSPGGSGPP
ncbi:hypothetical protein FQA39_LY19202 [Lamprigera yunnana]|nr:hypothetical protein FQA39_LY19202 [Lamprigera yunnana]